MSAPASWQRRAESASTSTMSVADLPAVGRGSRHAALTKPSCRRDVRRFRDVCAPAWSDTPATHDRLAGGSAAETSPGRVADFPNTRIPDANAVALAAREYARLGYRVFPVNVRTKAPWFRRGTHPIWAPSASGPAGLSCATDHPESVTAHWPTHEGVGVGIVPPNGVILVDADEKHRAGVVQWVLSRWPMLAAGGFHRTPSGGAHFPLRLEAHRLGQSANPRVGIDVRGPRGYVVAPPTSGYAVVRPFAAVDRLPEVPPGLVALLSRDIRLKTPRRAFRGDVAHLHAYVAAAVRGEQDRVSAAQEGTRNVILHAAAVRLGTLVGARVLGLQEAREALLSASEAYSDHARPLLQSEAARAVRSGLEYGCRHPREITWGTR